MSSTCVASDAGVSSGGALVGKVNSLAVLVAQPLGVPPSQTPRISSCAVAPRVTHSAKPNITAVTLCTLAHRHLSTRIRRGLVARLCRRSFTFGESVPRFGCVSCARSRTPTVSTFPYGLSFSFGSTCSCVFNVIVVAEVAPAGTSETAVMTTLDARNRCF